MRITKILHIPDLHFNQNINEYERKKIETNILHKLESCKPFDLIVSTGDITNKNEIWGLHHGFEFLVKLKTRLGNPPLLLTPGNHDVKWPKDLDELKIWDSHRRFEVFEKWLNHYIELGHNNLVTPFLHESQFSQSQTKAALNKLIEQNFKVPSDEEFKIYRPYIPYCWLRDSNIFCFILSSVDLSGASYVPASINIDRITEFTNTSEQRDLFKTLLQHDIPYVGATQLNTFEIIYNELTTNPQTKTDFRQALKLAIIHHPLVLMPGEAEIREFDNVVNGPDVISKLKGMGVSIILYGHKHVQRISINFGNWSLQPDYQTDFQEIATVAGGRVFLQDKMSDPSFQTIKVEDIGNSENNHYERVVRVESVFTEKDHRETKTLISLDKSGNIKWLNCNNLKFLTRGHNLNKEFYETISSIESDFYKEADWIKYYDDANDLIIRFFRFMKDFSKGDYGIDNKFLKDMEEDLQKAKAIYFIDNLGSPSWAHPNFLAHLAFQLRIFLIRNYNQLIGSKIWSHTDIVERTLQEDKHEHGSRKLLLKTPDGKLIRDKNIPQLNLDICRILIWKQNTLKDIPGRILIKLHKTFKIPLFFLDEQYYTRDEFPDKIEQDFHLVKYTRKLKGFWYDKKNLMRRKMQPPTAKSQLLTYEMLLNHPELKDANKALNEIVEVEDEVLTD